MLPIDLRPKTATYTPDPGRWLGIKYRGYWDFARLFYVRYKGHHLVFYSPFLEIPSEYSDYFIVYKCPGDDPGNWTEEYERWKISNIVPANDITLDETRKSYILAEDLDLMFTHFEWQPEPPPEPPAPGGA
jgi:hypothetical protein